MPLSDLLDLNDFLAPFAGEEVIYCPNPGNAGDSLIAAATIQLFEKHAIRPRWVCPKTVVEPGAVVFYGGGGNLIPPYPYASGFLEANHRQAKKLVLLPHTVSGNVDLLQSFGQNVDLIAREPVSYENCQSAAGAANIYLSEDLALKLDADALRAMPLDPPLARGLPKVRKSRRREIRKMMVGRYVRKVFTPFSQKRLTAFRTDCERTGACPLSWGNRDISDVFAYGMKSEESVLLAARHFMDYISDFKMIETDRLHVCIGAALLGKDVVFHPNSYYKNEAIYRHSLRDRFPLVSWTK